MVIATTARADLAIQRADGSWISLMMATEYDRDGNEQLKSIDEVLASSNADAPYMRELVPVVQETFSLGLGIHYNEAPGCYTRTDGYAMPAGAMTAITLPVGGAANTPIVAITEFDADIFFAEEGNGTTGGRVLRSVGGGTTLTASLSLAAGEIMRDLCVFDDGAGGQRLYASSTNASGENGRLHQWNGAAWTSTAALTFGANGRNKMKRVYWTTNDGIGAWRLVTITGPLTIAYTLPNADPMLAASWVENIKVLSDTYIDSLAAARHHIWIGSKSDVHDLNEQGESPGLMGYENRTPTGIPFPIQYFNDYVYRAGGNTLDRIYVGDGATLQSVPGMCAPGWGTPAENEWRGYPTAFAIDQGYLVAAIYNPTTGKTGIFWGFDHKGAYARETQNPLLWYGPEVVSAGTRRVTAMMPSMAASGERRLWIGSLTGSDREIVYVSLPIAGAPLQDLISGGLHRFATGSGSGAWQANSRISLMPESFDDKVSKKIIYAEGTGSRGLDAGTGTQMTLETRADPTPGQTTWASSHTITAGPSEEFIPATGAPVEGYKIERRYSFISPSGGATPPVVGVLDSCRMTAWKIAPDFGRRTLLVEYGAGVTDIDGRALPAEHIDPELITNDLVVLTRVARTTLRSRDDRRWTIHLLQVLDRHETYSGGKYGGKRVRARIECAMLAALSP